MKLNVLLSTGLIIVSGFLFSCTSGTEGEYSYDKPEYTDDGISTGTLENTKIDKNLISEAVVKMRDGKFGQIHSFLLYKDNMLVAEEYFGGYKYKWDGPGYRGLYVIWNKDKTHQVMSCTKSVTSACISIAIRQGYIRDVHDSIFDYLPDHQQFKSQGKEKITIEHLLTMTSGLEWNEWNAPHGTSANDIDRLYFECADDPVACVLNRRLVAEPGSTFTYNGGGFIILGEIIRNAAGTDLLSFAQKHLFSPLQTEVTRWDAYPNGELEAAGGLHLTPRDMLKFGVLYLQDGKWGDARVLSDGWPLKSATPYGNNRGIKIPIEDSGNNGYGYSWWTSTFKKNGKDIDVYRANGWGGQVIMVIPSENAVVVFTSGNYTSKSKLFKLLRKYIVPAI